MLHKWRFKLEMAVGGISQFINPVIDSIVSDRRIHESRSYVPSKDIVEIKVLAIGDENCQKDRLLLCCAYKTTFHLDVQERALLKRSKYSDISTQIVNIQCKTELLDTCECNYIKTEARPK